MPRLRLPIADHLTPEQIDRRYKACRHPVKRARWHLHWLLTRPDQLRSADQAARLLGHSGNWARALILRENDRGPVGLADRRARNGRRPALTPDQRVAALAAPPPDGGLWTTPKLARHVAEAHCVRLSRTAAWERLRGLGYRLRVPRPHRPGAATAEEQAERKWSRGRACPRALPGPPRPAPGGRVPGRGPAGAQADRPPGPGGTRPKAHGRTKYQWTCLYGFVHSATGRNLELILPGVNAEWMSLALAEFARWADPEGRKVLVVLVDNAGWHVAKRLRVPPNVVLRRLPPCTPELQPAEPLCPLVREAVANRGFANLDELAAVLL